MFGRKKEWVTGGSKTLHNDELPKLQDSSSSSFFTDGPFGQSVFIINHNL
jgi:hypothetical protein